MNTIDSTSKGAQYTFNGFNVMDERLLARRFFGEYVTI